jgi:hypothetical protein
MGLASFSAILEFAVGEESKASAFMAPLIQNSGAPNSELFKKIHSEFEKNRKSLQMILQENVTEMVMEPCENIDETTYILAPGLKTDEAGLAALLEKQVAFFKSASNSINLKEVKRVFDKMAERKLSLIGELKK